MFVHFEFNFFCYVIRIDEPDKGDKESSDEKHDSFLLDDAVLMRVKVFEGDGFDGKSH